MAARTRIRPLRTVEVQVLQEQKPATRDTAFGENTKSMPLILMRQQWLEAAYLNRLIETFNGANNY